MIVASSTGLHPVDSLQAELRTLARIATVVLNSHVNERGLCAICHGVAFPCESFVLAAGIVALG